MVVNSKLGFVSVFMSAVFVVAKCSYHTYLRNKTVMSTYIDFSMKNKAS